MIETIEVNAVEVQGVWDDKDEILKNAVAMWGILPKGMTELRKRVVEDNVANISKSGKHCKPSFLENKRPSKPLACVCRHGPAHTTKVLETYERQVFYIHIV